MVFLKIILLALTLSITAGQAPVKLIPKTAPAKPVQLKPITQPAKPQPGKSALLSPMAPTKPVKVQPQTPPQPTKSLLIPRTTPAPAQKQIVQPQAIATPATPKEPFDLKKVIAERKALNKSKALPILKSEYYTPENLQKLKSQGIPYHLPCTILIDPEKHECPDCKLFINTFALAGNLITADNAIICTSSLAHNLFYRLQNPETSSFNSLFKQATEDFTFNRTDWDVYDVVNSQFILFVPKKFAPFYNNELNINQSNKLTLINSHLSEEPNYTNFINWLNVKKNTSIKFSKENLQTIFISKKNYQQTFAPIWDFFVSGHGTMGVHIAGLTHTETTDFLSFFDSEIRTGTLDIMSCYAGGKNLQLLQFEQSGIPVSHNYILIVNSISDETVGGLLYISDFFKFTHQFFNNAAQLSNKGEALNQLLQSLDVLSTALGSPHGTANIPQVWLPNGMGFQTFNIDKEIFSLGKVILTVHENEKKPIIIKNRRAVLIYPKSISVPLIVGISGVSTLSQEYKAANLPFVSPLGKKFARWKSIPAVTENAFWAELTDPQVEQIAQKIHKEFPAFKLETPSYYKNYSDIYLYPQFIPMSPTGDDYYLYFKEINLENNDCLTCGVMRFIRDTFFDLVSTEVFKTTYIDSLTGYNDIALLIRARNLKNETFSSSTEFQPTYEDDELAKNSNKKITLKNVKIRTYKTPLLISFELDGKAWRISNPLETGWYFSPIDIKQYRASYESSKQKDIIQDKPDQKSISEILQLKQQEILKKKTASKKAQNRYQRKTMIAMNKK